MSLALLSQLYDSLKQDQIDALTSALAPIRDDIQQIKAVQQTFKVQSTDPSIYMTAWDAAHAIYGPPKTKSGEPRGYRNICKLREWGVIPTDGTSRVLVADCRKHLPNFKQHRDQHDKQRLKLRKGRS